LFRAIEEGAFANVRRRQEDGKGLEGVLHKARDYYTPLQQYLTPRALREAVEGPGMGRGDSRRRSAGPAKRPMRSRQRGEQDRNERRRGGRDRPARDRGGRDRGGRDRNEARSAERGREGRPPRPAPLEVREAPQENREAPVSVSVNPEVPSNQPREVLPSPEVRAEAALKPPREAPPRSPRRGPPGPPRGLPARSSREVPGWSKSEAELQAEFHKQMLSKLKDQEEFEPKAAAPPQVEPVPAPSEPSPNYAPLPRRNLKVDGAAEPPKPPPSDSGEPHASSESSPPAYQPLPRRTLKEE
jgi:hypothetical protein